MNFSLPLSLTVNLSLPERSLALQPRNLQDGWDFGELSLSNVVFIYPLFFHILTHSSARRETVIPCVFITLHTLSITTGVYPLIIPQKEQNEPGSHPIQPYQPFAAPRLTTNHGSRDKFPPVAALPPGCYDLVSHDPC
jgi:hypothetical protein